jgi:8-oxo-dGTP pyrophosphatase MutT (NUDIX family)
MSSFTLAELRARLAALPRIDDAEAEAAAAVAAILRPGLSGAEILLIKRADREGDPWSGHLAFPGGKREPLDASLLCSSIRETREEVGLTLDATSFLARLEDVRARTNGYKVAQFVFAIDDPRVPLLTNVEVKDTLWVPLRRIEESQGKETITRNVMGRSMELPCVELGEYVLWGMTLRMVMQVIAAGTDTPCDSAVEAGSDNLGT